MNLLGDLLQGEVGRAFRFQKFEKHQLLGRRIEANGSLLDGFDQSFAGGGTQ